MISVAKFRLPNRCILRRCISYCCIFLLTLGCEAEKSSKHQAETVPQTLDTWVAEGSVMGTSYRVKLIPHWLNNSDTNLNLNLNLNLKKRIESASEEVSTLIDHQTFQEVVSSIFNRVNRLMSTYLNDSEVSQINHASVGQCTSVSEETREVLELATEVSQSSEGKFDFTIGPLVDQWGFGKKESSVPPTPAQIQQSLDVIGYEAIKLEQSGDGTYCVVKKAPRQIDLSAIAKGYAVDLLRNVLVEAGATGFLIELGGEVWAQGEKASGLPWKIAIERPDAFQRKAAFVLKVKDIGVATSGDYRNYFEFQGKKYAHTIDPDTGYPVDNGLASVTLMMSSTAMADAWATALFATPIDTGLQLAERNNIQMLMIIRLLDGTFKLKASSAFCEYQDCSLIK